MLLSPATWIMWHPTPKTTVYARHHIVTHYKTFHLLDHLHHTTTGFDDLPAWYLQLTTPFLSLTGDSLTYPLLNHISLFNGRLLMPIFPNLLLISGLSPSRPFSHVYLRSSLLETSYSPPFPTPSPYGCPTLQPLCLPLHHCCHSLYPPPCLLPNFYQPLCICHFLIFFPGHWLCQAFLLYQPTFCS